jgi:hypothetical protein
MIWEFERHVTAGTNSLVKVVEVPKEEATESAAAVEEDRAVCGGGSDTLGSCS